MLRMANLSISVRSASAPVQLAYYDMYALNCDESRVHHAQQIIQKDPDLDGLTV